MHTNNIVMSEDEQMREIESIADEEEEDGSDEDATDEDGSEDDEDGEYEVVPHHALWPYPAEIDEEEETLDNTAYGLGVTEFPMNSEDLIIDWNFQTREPFSDVEMYFGDEASASTFVDYIKNLAVHGSTVDGTSNVRCKRMYGARQDAEHDDGDNDELVCFEWPDTTRLYGMKRMITSMSLPEGSRDAPDGEPLPINTGDAMSIGLSFYRQNAGYDHKPRNEWLNGKTVVFTSVPGEGETDVGSRIPKFDNVRHLAEHLVDLARNKLEVALELVNVSYAVGFGDNQFTPEVLARPITAQAINDQPTAVHFTFASPTNCVQAYTYMRDDMDFAFRVGIPDLDARTHFRKTSTSPLRIEVRANGIATEFETRPTFMDHDKPGLTSGEGAARNALVFVPVGSTHPPRLHCDYLAYALGWWLDCVYDEEYEDYEDADAILYLLTRFPRVSTTVFDRAELERSLRNAPQLRASHRLLVPSWGSLVSTRMKKSA